MEYSGLNLAGILVATFIGMALGALWYSPLLFGKRWIESIGKTPDTLGGSTLPMIGSVVANLMTAVDVSILFSFIDVESISMGIAIGLTLGLLIIFPALISDNLFCG